MRNCQICQKSAIEEHEIDKQMSNRQETLKINVSIKILFSYNGNTQTFLRWYVFLAHLCWQWTKLCRRTSWSPWWAVSCLHLSVVSSLLHFKSPTDTSIHHRPWAAPRFHGPGFLQRITVMLFHNLCSWSKNISWNLSVFFS